eukprot:m.168943 g.168943  ORF g.168943 m.168943 type:complete len:73 (+) comp15264_c1_seq3:35-253(+)
MVKNNLGQLVLVRMAIDVCAGMHYLAQAAASVTLVSRLALSLSLPRTTTMPSTAGRPMCAFPFALPDGAGAV